MVFATLICKTLSKMKCIKAVGTSGIIVQMLKAAGEEGVELTRQLTEAVFSYGVIPGDWKETFIPSLYSCKSEALDSGNYHGLNLPNKAIKLLGQVLDFYIHDMLNMGEIQFSFVRV